jgi:hypothetical protein
MNPFDVLQFIGIPVGVATVMMLLSWWLLPTKRLQPVGAVLAVGMSYCKKVFRVFHQPKNGIG